MSSADTLTVLSGFKTLQQSSEWSCGPASALMVLEWFGRAGGLNERALAELRSGIGAGPGVTCLSHMIDIFNAVGGFDLFSTYDAVDDPRSVFTPDFIRETLAGGVPVMVAWYDWGGHRQVIIGYDTMGTEDTRDDVIIVADPYDTTDHNQDGYGVYSFERFLSGFTLGALVPEDSGEIRDCCFLIAVPAA